MNVKRFVGRNAREAMAQARAAFGEQAVVLANRPVPQGVEILAMQAADVPVPAGAPRALPAPDGRMRPVRAGTTPAPVPAAMSTLSFQDYVRERQRQQAQEDAQRQPAATAAVAAREPAAPWPREPAQEPRRAWAPQAAREASQAFQREARHEASRAAPRDRAPAALAEPAPPRARETPRDVPRDMPRDLPPVPPPSAPARFATEALRAEPPLPAAARASAAVAPATADTLRTELQQMRSMIQNQLAGMAWYDQVRRSPPQARLLRLLIGNGFSPALARMLVEHLPAGIADDQADAWAAQAVARNLRCAGDEAILERGGAFALVGPTGVGKTTTAAKLAARFAMKHGAASVGLITVDTYRMAASDQLRAFGRILQIPVHVAHDAASLADLLHLLSGKKLVLVDTLGLGQRDRRVPELFASLPAGLLQRLLVLNAGAQGETLEEVVRAYGAGPGTRCVLSKLDEAARAGMVLDVVLRHRLVVEGVANGQRVPEDWHAVRAELLAHRALMKAPRAAFEPDDAEIGLLLTMPEAGALHA